MPPWLKQIVDTSRSKKGSIKIKLTTVQVFLSVIENQNSLESEIASPAMERLQALCMPKTAKQLRDEVEDGVGSPTSPSTGQNYCRDIIKTLWSLLNESGDADY